MKRLVEHPLIATVGLLAAVVGVLWTMYKLDSDAQAVFDDLDAIQVKQARMLEGDSASRETIQQLAESIDRLADGMDRRMDKLEHEHKWLSDVRTSATDTGSELLVKALEDLVAKARLNGTHE